MTALYRAALVVLPRDVRARHGEQMAHVFADQAREARRRGGWAGSLATFARELAALAWFAVCERMGAPLPPRIDERQLAWPADPADLRRESLAAGLAQDLRFAARQLWRSPGFTAVCVATMALAIGANTAIFSVVDGVLLKPLPYPGSARLVALAHFSPAPGGLDSTTPANFYEMQARATAFESMAGVDGSGAILSTPEVSERVVGAVSVGSVFDVLQRPAAHGRTFTAAEDRPGGAPVIVLRHGLAERLFGSAQGAVGRSLGVGGEPFTVIGVMPPDFTFPDHDTHFWAPARYSADFRQNRDQYNLVAVGRLKPGVSAEQARVELDTIVDGIRAAWPQYNQDVKAGVVPLKEFLVADVRSRVLFLMGAVGLILLIACANLGNLLLARVTTRRREMAVRAALGARPLRLVRQTLTESLLLAALGGVAGLATACLLHLALASYIPEDLPRAHEVAIDARVLAFTAAVSLLAGLVFGLVPAVQVALRQPLDAIREGARGSVRSRRVRSLFVVSEVAFALMLLAAAGLLVRSFGRLGAVNPGFATRGLLTFRVSVPTKVYDEPEKREAFFLALADRLRGVPGADSVTYSTTLPVSGRGWGAWLNRVDRPTPADRTPPSVRYRVVSPNYFTALGVPVVRGRGFEEHDGQPGRRAVVISEAAAEKHWPGEDPIGKRLYLGAPDNRLFEDAEIVGVAADVKSALDESRGEVVYCPIALTRWSPDFSFAIRTTADPLSLASAARAVVRGMEPEAPVMSVATMDEVVSRSLAPARATTVLVGLFSAVAVALALIGVFGVLSYDVAQQWTELGIRRALGASSGAVVRHVLLRGMSTVAVGVVLGLVGASILSRSMEGLLFGVKPGDPATLATVALLLTLVALGASWLPARRAARVDPAVVLRQ
jgi:putative ABC transport system permease protein